MTNFYVTYRFKDNEACKAFYREVKASGAAEKTREEDGCIRYDFFFCADDETAMLLWEQWESRGAQKVHLNQPHYLEFAGIKERYGVKTDILVQDAQQ